MTWTWSQSAGELRRAGKVIARGYAGHGPGVNDPDMQQVASVGPLPRGLYQMTELRLQSPSTGPYTIVLAPFPGVRTFGRSAFRIHGDNAQGNRSASHGCIILPRIAREQIWRSGDYVLEVVR